MGSERLPKINISAIKHINIYIIDRTNTVNVLIFIEKMAEFFSANICHKPIEKIDFRSFLKFGIVDASSLWSWSMST